MKKYNLSEIMKRAWEIKKENTENIFSLCLRMAWQETKKPNLLKPQKLPLYTTGKLTSISVQNMIVIAITIRSRYGRNMD